MNAAALIERAATSGVTIRLDGDRLKVNGPRDACDALLPELREHKPEIIEFLSSSGDEFEKLRDELVWLVTEDFILENWLWTLDQLDAELEDAMTGSPASLMPNLLHYRALVASVHAEIIARELAAGRILVVTAEVLAARRWCHPSCKGQCIGRRVSCSRDGIAPPQTYN